MNNTRTSLWLKLGVGAAIALALFLITRGGCNTDINLSGLLGGQNTTVKTDTIIKVQRDTVVQYRSDTVWQRETVYLDREVPSPPKIVYLPATEDSVSLYQGENKDSTVNLKYRAWIKGELVNIQLGYELLQPRIIRDTVLQRFTEVTTETITNEVVRGGFYIGGGLNYGYSQRTLNNALTPVFGASYLSAKGRSYSLNYVPATGQVQATVKQRIF